MNLSFRLTDRSRSVALFVALYLLASAAVAVLISHSGAALQIRPAAPALVTDTDGLNLAGGSQSDDAEVHGTRMSPHQVRAALAVGYVADVAAVRAQGYTVVLPTNLPGPLAASASAIASQLSSFGIRMKVVRSNTTTLSAGMIRVFQKTDCTGTLLGLTSRTQGGVWNDDTNNWTITSLWASVGICTRTVKMNGAWLKATVQHEMGHALGLGHFTSTYSGKYQIMKPILSAGMVGYQAGDANGLKHLVAGVPRD